MGRIKYLFLDVDGTLTDGHIYISSSGEIMKAFDVKDGYGIHSLLRKMGIEPVIITGRQNEIVAKRAAELNIKYVFQGVSDKITVMKEFLSSPYGNNQRIEYSDCAYMGDDIPDLACMKMISENGGISACPSDSSIQIVEIAHFVCKKSAGNGAVREFIDWLYSRQHE